MFFFVIRSAYTKILELNQYWKFDDKPSIMYAGFKSLIKEIDGCKNTSEKSSITKVGEHIPCGYLISTI